MSYLALIVEDEAPLRTLYEIVLRSVGFDTVHAADGQQALDFLASSTPNMVVLDMLLPKVNGTIVLDYLCNTPRLRSTGILVVSAHNKYSIVDNDSQIQFLLKPIRPDDIKNAISRILATT